MRYDLASESTELIGQLASAAVHFDEAGTEPGAPVLRATAAKLMGPRNMAAPPSGSRRASVLPVDHWDFGGDGGAACDGPDA